MLAGRSAKNKPSKQQTSTPKSPASKRAREEGDSPIKSDTKNPRLNSKESSINPNSPDTSFESVEEESQEAITMTSGTLNATDLANIKALIDQALDDKLDPQIDAITKRLEKTETHLEKMKRSKNMMIFGIPEESNESTNDQVDAVNILFAKMGVTGVILDDVYRVGAKGKAKRPLLVKLVRTCDKRTIFAEKKKLKGENIYISDDLSPEELEREKILLKAFATMKKADPGLRKAIRKGVLTIWKDGKVQEKLAVEEGSKNVVSI